MNKGAKQWVTKMYIWRDKILWLKSSWILGLFVAWVVVGLCEDKGSYEQEEFTHDGA